MPIANGKVQRHSRASYISILEVFSLIVMFNFKNFSIEFDDNIVTDTARQSSKNTNGRSLSANDENDDAKQRSSTNNVNFQTDRALFAHLTSSALHVRVGTSAYRSAANVPPLRLPLLPLPHPFRWSRTRASDAFEYLFFSSATSSIIFDFTFYENR